MPRPRTIDDEAVLDAALEVVRREGPNRVTFARVAERVGLSPAALVQRFGSKRKLLLAVARRADPLPAELIDRLREGEESPLEVLLAALAVLASSVGTREAMANSLAFLHLDLSDPDFHRLARDGMRRMQERIRALLDEAAEAGEVRRTDTGTLARAVQNAYNGALISWAIYGRGSAERWLRRELELVLEPYRR